MIFMGFVILGLIIMVFVLINKHNRDLNRIMNHNSTCSESISLNNTQIDASLRKRVYYYLLYNRQRVFF
jgi:hypothetical protein